MHNRKETVHGTGTVTEITEETQQKQPKYSKKIVVLVIVLNVVFALCVLFLSYYGDEVSDTLIEKWFDFTSIELLSMAAIKSVETVKTGVVEVASHKYDELAKNDIPDESDKG